MYFRLSCNGLLSTPEYEWLALRSGCFITSTQRLGADAARHRQQLPQQFCQDSHCNDWANPASLVNYLAKFILRFCPVFWWHHTRKPVCVSPFCNTPKSTRLCDLAVVQITISETLCANSALRQEYHVITSAANMDRCQRETVNNWKDQQGSRVWGDKTSCYTQNT
jgi:hypothetical protein